MKIKKLRLVDYKRFHDLTIDLGDEPARIVALVGSNGCGKSSVFDGMLYLNNVHNVLGRESNNTTDYRYHSLNQEVNYSFDKVSIDFDQGSFQEVREARQKTGYMNTIFSFRSSFRYNGQLNVQDSRAVSDVRNNDYGASTAADIDERIEENYRRLRIKYDRYLNENDCKPSEAKKHIIGELNMAVSSCISIEIDSLGNIEDAKGTLFFKKSDTSTPFGFNVLSSGEKEVVDLLIDLYLRKDEFTDSIYIIDEPELHLNTAIQKKLLIEIDNMVPKNCQIWMATHSIGFLRGLQDDLRDQSQVIMFEAKNNWASETYTLKPIKKTRMEWLSAFETALDDLTRLIAPKIIIYCEGRAEPGKGGIERGLDAKVYNTVFENAYPEVLFVSSGGNTELDQRSAIALTVLSKALPKTDILILKDRDMASGKDTNEKTRQQYLAQNPNNHRILRRLEIENYLYDKEVLKAYCVQNGCYFDENLYDSLVTDIDNQNVKDKTGKIKSICNIKGSISAERFKENLAKCINPSMKIYRLLEEDIFRSGFNNQPV